MLTRFRLGLAALWGRRGAGAALLVGAVVSLAVSLGPAELLAAGREDTLPAKFRRAPYSLMSLSVGHPNAGWQLRPIKLKKRRYLVIKKGSESEVWGHPALVKMLYRTARDLSKSASGTKMLVGDLSSKAGGPLAGHASHQSGRDADVGFFAKDAKGKRVVLDHFVAFGGDGKALDNSGLVFDDWRNWLLVQSWIRDHRADISHIFVSRPLRARLLAYARGNKGFKKYVEEATKLLKEPSDSSAHDDHFHVRIACPKKQQEICHDEPR